MTDAKFPHCYDVQVEKESADSDQELDVLLASMQISRAKEGTRTAFNASPAQFGRAALLASKKRITASKKKPQRGVTALRASKKEEIVPFPTIREHRRE